MRLPFPRSPESGIVARDTVDLPTDAGQTHSEVLRGAFALLSAQPLTWAVSLAAVALVPRYLGADGMGRFVVAWTVGVLVGTLGSLGIQSYLIRVIATEPTRAAAYAWGGVALVATCSVLIGAGALSTAAVLALRIDLSIAAIAVATAVVVGVNGVLMATLVGVGRNARYAWSLAASSVGGSLAGLAALVLGGGALGYALAIFAAWGVATAFVWRVGGPPFTRSGLRPVVLRQLVVGGLPFLAWNIAIRVRADIDVILTGLLLQASVAGWLAAAYRIINITVFIPAAITMPLLPALSRNKGQPDLIRSVLREALATVLLLTVPVSASIFALAPSIPGLLGWPESFANSVPLMQWLAFQQTVVGVDMVLATALVALGLERKWLAVAVFGAVLNPLLNLFAIPFAASVTGNGAIGAAIVELATELVHLGGAIVLMPRHLLGRDDLLITARIAMAGVIMLAVTLPLRPYGLVLALGCGGVAYVLSAFAVGALGRHQINSVRVALRLA